MVSTPELCVLATLAAVLGFSARQRLVGLAAVLAALLVLTPDALLALPLAGVVLTTTAAIWQMRSAAAPIAIIGLAAVAAAVFAAVERGSVAELSAAFPEYLLESSSVAQATWATVGILAAGAVLAFPWPLSTFAVAAGKDRVAMPLFAVLTASAILVLLRLDDRPGMSVCGVIRQPWAYAGGITHLVAALLAIAHTNLRTKLLCLLLSQSAWIVSAIPVAIRPLFGSESASVDLVIIRWAGSIIGLLVAHRLIEALISRYGATDVADYRGLGRTHRLWSVGLVAALLLVAAPLPLFDPTAAVIVSTVRQVSSEATTCLIIGGVLTTIAAFDLVGRLIFGPLDRPMYGGTLFRDRAAHPDVATRLLGRFGTTQVALWLGLAYIAVFGRPS